MKVVCPECGHRNSINPEKGSRDKLCTECRTIISKAGRRPSPTWKMEKEDREEARGRMRARGQRKRPPPLEMTPGIFRKMGALPFGIVPPPNVEFVSKEEFEKKDEPDR